MRENNLQQESGAGYAVASFLLNLLVLLVVLGSFWFMYSLLTDTNGIGVFLRETAFR